MLDLERPKDAISVLVRLIVQQPNHKLVKRTLAQSLQTPLGLECLYEELSTAAAVASALVRTRRPNPQPQRTPWVEVFGLTADRGARVRALRTYVRRQWARSRA